MKNKDIYYSLGALLYTPAYNTTIIKNLTEEKFGKKYSLSFCLEDTINDNFVEKAENILIDTIKKLYIIKQKQNFYLPNLFIRVRSPEQIIKLTTILKSEISLIKGFIIPKFCIENYATYKDAILKANDISKKQLYFMPTLESDFLIDLNHRIDNLYLLKDYLDNIEDLVLNIRVGGNDLSNFFSVRRNVDETIYKISPIANIFSDIITIFSEKYIISGPVWEYYSGENWKEGLINEIKEDKLMGFVGKTVIHPNQIPIVNECLKVSKCNYEDAKNILEWNQDSIEYVLGNSTSNRMNEYKTHKNWAEKIIHLYNNFGVK